MERTGAGPGRFLFLAALKPVNSISPAFCQLFSWVVFMSSGGTTSSAASVADNVTKGIAAGAVLLFVAGILSPADFAIIMGLGFLWLARTKTLRM